jgi:hypothetical protein
LLGRCQWWAVTILCKLFGLQGMVLAATTLVLIVLWSVDMRIHVKAGHDCVSCQPSALSNEPPEVS